MSRFEVLENSDDDKICINCSNSIFDSSNDKLYGYFCMDCSPKEYICTNCKEKYLSSHTTSHTLGTIFFNEEEFIDSYKFEIEETCNQFLINKKYSDCIKFCQKSLKYNPSAEIAIITFKIGMICHVKLFEYSEGKKCGKTALKIIESMEKDKENFAYDEVEIVCKLCHIYLKLAKPEKCLEYGLKILEKNYEETVPEEIILMVDEIRFFCGKAFYLLEQYENSKSLLESCLIKKCEEKNYVKARLALSTLLRVFLDQGKREEGDKKYNDIKNKYPDILKKLNDLDVSFIKLKKSVNKLKDIPEKLMTKTSSNDDVNSLDNKIIDFNKQHYLSIIDNDFNSSYPKLVKAIDTAEELIYKFPDNSHIETVIKKRNQLIKRMYCCCVLRKKPLEAFQWAEKGKSLLLFSRLIKEDKTMKVEDKTKLRLLKKKINVEELIKIAKENDTVFIFFVIIQEMHFKTGEFIDIWVIGSLKKDKSQTKDIVRTRLTHKPIEIIKLILELFTEINKINSSFNKEVEKQGFKNSVKDIKKWQIFIDKLFQRQLRNDFYKKYLDLLEELYIYLVIPIQHYLQSEIKVKKNKSMEESEYGKSRNYKKKPRVIIVPEDFSYYIPYPFLKPNKNDYFLDNYCVSITHCCSLYLRDLETVMQKRKRREVKLNEAKDKGLFGLILTDEYNEYRKTELLPIFHLLNSCMKSKVEELSETVLLSNSTKENISKTFEDHVSTPKIVSFSNHSVYSGKDLPTFQKELNPRCGVKLCEGESLLSTDIEKFDLEGTEIVVFGHSSSISGNDCLDSMNDVHRSVIIAGCSSILYPLFDISEFFSTLFFIQFFKHLFGTDLQVKKSKGEAYRHAMQSSMQIFPYLRTAPFFLSSFLLFGDSISEFD